MRNKDDPARSQTRLKQLGVGSFARTIQVNQDDRLSKILLQQVLRQMGSYKPRSAE
jgi:hypothetical protein